MKLLPNARVALPAALAATLLAGCTGNIDGRGTPGAAPGGPAVGAGGRRGTPAATGSAGGTALPPIVGGSGAAGMKPAPAGAGTMPMRRLARAEYENSVRDLVGVTVTLAVPDETAPGPSGYGWPADVTQVERAAFEQAADTVAGKAAIAQLAACPSGSAERACAETFIAGFGKRAFRRPLTDTESQRLVELYTALRAAPAAQSHDEALRGLLAAMLQSPQFLYRWELGPQSPGKDAAGLVKLTGWEIASRLSYLFWGTTPDAALLQAAESGALDTPAGIETQGRRLLADKARATHFLGALFGRWVGFQKLPKLLKDKALAADFSDDLKAAMRQQTEQFLAGAVLGEGQWSAVLTSRASFINAALAKLMGEPATTSPTLVPRTFGPERPGLFTQAAFLNIKALPQESSPVHRGKVIAERLLCRTIIPPPPDLVVNPPPIAPGVQTRQAYVTHATDPACSACHAMIDPPGFAFESFDAVGRYRTMEAGRPVDASGTLSLDGKTVAFKDAPEMMAALAASAEVRACAVTQWMRFALGRELGDGDARALAAAREAFGGGDLRELALAIVRSDSFRLRVPSDGEVTR